MGGKKRGNQGKDKGKMKVGVEGSKKETVTEKEQAARKETETEKEEQGAIMDTEKQQQKQKEVEEQGARKETETETETGEDDLLDRCVFLVRTRNTNFPSQPPTEKSVLRRPLCLQEDFHYIDLRTKFVIPNYFPSLINCVGTGTMLMFDNRQVYILGDIDPFRPRIPHTHNEFNNHIHKHTGSSRTSISNCWKPFVISDSNRKLVNPAVLSNKLYCFGYPCLRPEVYDPHASKVVWNPLFLPDHLVEKRVSMHVLPDPLNNRIIVHFPIDKMLYAFYPHLEKEDGDGPWKCITPCFDEWHSAIAIADNIIFIHSYQYFPDFAAYDINTSTWLHILWDLSKVDRFIIRFDAMFTLSDKGLMCLASRDGSDVHFLRFRVKRTSDSHLKCTAIDYQIHDLPSAIGINDIILF